MPNSVDHDETARDEPSYLDLHCLQVLVLVCRAKRVTAPITTTVDNILRYFFIYFSTQVAKQTIHVKRHDLFSPKMKNK